MLTTRGTLAWDRKRSSAFHGGAAAGRRGLTGVQRGVPCPHSQAVISRELPKQGLESLQAGCEGCSDTHYAATALLQTRILVTHGISFLPQVDNIVVLVAGAVSEYGSYSTLLANRGAFAQFLNLYGGQEEDASEKNTAGTGKTAGLRQSESVPLSWGHENPKT